MPARKVYDREWAHKAYATLPPQDAKPMMRTLPKGTAVEMPMDELMMLDSYGKVVEYRNLKAMEAGDLLDDEMDNAEMQMEMGEDAEQSEG